VRCSGMIGHRRDRERVRALVAHDGFSRLFQSLWPADVHHRRRQKNLTRSRLAERVQMPAGHAALSTTQRYIEADVEAQPRKVVELI